MGASLPGSPNSHAVKSDAEGIFIHNTRLELLNIYLKSYRTAGGEAPQKGRGPEKGMALPSHTRTISPGYNVR
jgi:hypothetical protein